MTEEMRLEEIRSGIDEIDGKLLNLFCRRMELVAGVAEYKRRHNLPTLRPEREREILDRAVEQVDPALKEYVRRFFSGIMGISRDYQDALRNSEDSE